MARPADHPAGSSGNDEPAGAGRRAHGHLAPARPWTHRYRPVLHVPDGHVWIVGDVVEASGPPMYGSGCFPLELPDQLAFLLGELDDRDVVVPGHGPVVGRAFVASQLAEVERLAQQIRSAHLWGFGRASLGGSRSVAASGCRGLELAVRRAYAHLDNATVHEQVIQSAAPTTSRR